MHELYRPVATLIEKVAADIVLPRYQNLAAHEISEKAADDFVTIADKESEIALEAGLRAILPEAGVIGEEACAADLSILDGAGTGLQWIIDPIDGTANFASGKPPFALMVALADGGTTIAGWIYDPLARRMCHAGLGKGCFVDGERITARETGAALPLTAFAIYFLTLEERTDLLARAEGKLEMVEIPRCAGEQYPRLFLGQNDIATFERSWPWDHAAGGLMLNEAGGRLSRRDGSEYVVGDRKSGLLGASSQRMWEKAAATLY